MNTDQKIIEKYIHEHPAEVALLMENVEADKIVGVINSLTESHAVLLLNFLDRYKAATIFELLDLSKTSALMQKLPIQKSKTILPFLTEKRREEVINELPQRYSSNLQRVLKFSKKMVGAHIDPMIGVLYEDMSVAQGVEKMQNQPALPRIYVLKRDQTLVGFVEIQELMTSDPSVHLGKIMQLNPMHVMADMDVSLLADIWANNELINHLPVIDEETRFLGIVMKQKALTEGGVIKPLDRHLMQAGGALAELFQIGLTGLFTGISSSPNQK